MAPKRQRIFSQNHFKYSSRISAIHCQQNKKISQKHFLVYLQCNILFKFGVQLVNVDESG